MIKFRDMDDNIHVLDVLPGTVIHNVMEQTNLSFTAEDIEIQHAGENVSNQPLANFKGKLLQMVVKANAGA